MDESYREFVSKVAAARKRQVRGDRTPRARTGLARFAGPIANGLVDEFGGLDRAIALIKKRAGIPASEQVRVQLYPEPAGLLDLIMSRTSPEQMLDAGWPRYSAGFLSGHG